MKNATEKLANRQHRKISTVTVTLLIFAAIFCTFSMLSPYFLPVKNFLNILQYSAVSGTIAVGMTFVVIGGGIDISVGSVVTLVGMVLSMIMPDSGGVFGMIIIGLLIGAVCGFINGFFITKINIAPFVVTLGSMAIYKGFAFLTTKGVNTPFMNRDFMTIGRGSILNGIPISFIIMLLLLLVCAFVLKMTPFGKKLYNVGSNSAASKLTGINVDRTKWLTYIISGLCAALAGIISVSQQGAGLTQLGEGAELPAITAAVLGGANLDGGEGNMLGTLVGVLLLNMITNGLNLLGVSSYWQLFAQGAILVFSVSINIIRLKKK